MAMKPEQRVYHYRLKPALRAIPGLEFQRVELSTHQAGMPDVLYTYGRTGFIENKHSTATDWVDLTGWSRAQRRWARHHGNAGAIVFLLVGTPRSTHLVAACYALDEKALEFDDPRVLANWGRTINRRELGKILKEHPL